MPTGAFWSLALACVAWSPGWRSRVVAR
jgi:hypothetical protein